LCDIVAMRVRAPTLGVAGRPRHERADHRQDGKDCLSASGRDCLPAPELCAVAAFQKAKNLYFSIRYGITTALARALRQNLM
jgi:hypothetical protein